MRNAIILLLVFFLLGLGVYGSYLYLQKQRTGQQAASVANPVKPDDLEIIQPKLDILHGKQVFISPGTGATIQVKTAQHITITLRIPPQALHRATTIKVVPFLEDGKTSTLDTGVLISPGDLTFAVPATLSFDLQGSQVQPTPPVGSIRSSHIYRLIPRRQSIMPILIARASETETYVPGRIIAGGAYALSLASSRAEALSRVVLADKNSLPLTILEAATYLANSGKRLSTSEKKTAETAVTYIFSQIEPVPVELFAALSLGTYMNKVIIPDVSPTLNSQCNNANLGKEDYQAAAAAAQLLEDESLAHTCKTAATTIPVTPLIEEETLFTATPSAADMNDMAGQLREEGYRIIPLDNDNTGYTSPLVYPDAPTPTI